MTKVTDMNHLKSLTSPDSEEFFISLAGGLCRSSKRIQWFENENLFDVYNENDDTWEEDITEKELGEFTNIVDAIENGALYMY
jgi:hypothetical protein